MIKRYSEEEFRPDVLSRVDIYLSAELLDDELRYSQPETHASLIDVLAAAGLTEELKELRQILHLDANA